MTSAIEILVPDKDELIHANTSKLHLPILRKKESFVKELRKKHMTPFERFMNRLCVKHLNKYFTMCYNVNEQPIGFTNKANWGFEIKGTIYYPNGETRVKEY